MNKEFSNFSPLLAAIRTVLEITDMRHLLTGADAKRFQRFLRSDNIIAHDEFEIDVCRLFGNSQVDSNTLRVVGLELLHEINWCRRMAFPKTNWSNPKESWKIQFETYLINIMSYFSFRVAFSNLVTGGLITAPLPKCPTWILPRKGVSATGRFIAWWQRKVGMDTETFELAIEACVNDKRTLAKWKNGTSSPSGKDILKLAAVDYACYHSKEITPEWRESMRVGLFIARCVDQGLIALSAYFGQTASTHYLEIFISSYKELLRGAYRECISVYFAADLDGVNTSYDEWRLAKKIIRSTVEERSPALSIIKELHEERLWLTPFEEERNAFVQCLTQLPAVIDAEDSTESIVQYFKDVPNNGNLHAFSIPFFQGLGLVLQKEVESGYDFLWEAFCNARYQAANITPLIIDITYSTACYLYSQKKSSGKDRKQYNAHIKEMRLWSQWHDFCPYLWGVAPEGIKLSKEEEERRLLEIGRRRFEARFGEIISSPEIGKSSKEKFKGRLNAIIKEYGLDTNKLMAAIEDHDEKRALKFIEDGIDLNFRTLLESNAFSKAMEQEHWEFKYTVAEAILSRDENPISPETLMTCVWCPFEEELRNILPSTLITSRGQIKYTALHMALVHRRPIFLKLLIRRGVDITERISTEYGELSPLLYAVLNSASDIADRPWPGCCGGGYGTSTGAIENVRLLLSVGAKPNDVHDEGMTALFQAVLLDQLDIVRLLLVHGAKTNCQLENGLTLKEACRSFSMEALLEPLIA